MAWDANDDWAGEFTGHNVQHDLEAFVWLMWVLCVNLDGPFNKKRFECKAFKKADYQRSMMKCVKLDDIISGAGATSSRKSKSSLKKLATTTPGAQRPSTSKMLPGPIAENPTIDSPPTWVRPGLHSTQLSEVVWSKAMMLREEDRFADYLSPYFSKYVSVKEGFIEFTRLFVWRLDKNRPQGGRAQYLPPTPTTYKVIIDIIKAMRDGIEPELDGPPSQEVIENARNEFMGLLKKGNLEVPVLGRKSRPSQTKKRSRSLRDDD